MNIQQSTRMNKVNNEPFYLLNLSKNNNGNYIFDISGSTANLYQTTLYPESGTVFCNCPDGKSWAKKTGCICKHACFMFIKVLKINKDQLISNFFTKNLKMTPELLLIVTNKLTELENTNLKNQAFVNNDYLEKFQKMKLSDTNSSESSVKTPTKDKYQVEKDLDENQECMICFDLMGKISECIGCPMCHNLIHKTCMEKWLENGQKTCIYCRSEVWKDYGKKHSEKAALENQYKNLLD
jgi:hypothetical protein